MFRYLLFPLVWGPGSWFIPALLITVIVFPLIFIIFDVLKKIKISLIALIISFGIEVAWQYLINFSMNSYINNYYGTPDWSLETYYFLYFALICNPFRLMSAIGMGIWLSQNQKLFSLRNILIWILGIMSGFCIFIYTFYENEPIPYQWTYVTRYLALKAQELLDWSNGDYNFIFFPYSALIVLLFLNILPKNPNGAVPRFITLISKSTYHILMVQIFYFSIVYNYFLPMFGEPAIWASVYPDIEWINLMFYPINVVWTFGWGIFWYWVESKYREKRKSEKNKGLLKRAKARGWIK